MQAKPTHFFLLQNLKKKFRSSLFLSMNLQAFLNPLFSMSNFRALQQMAGEMINFREKLDFEPRVLIPHYAQ